MTTQKAHDVCEYNLAKALGDQQRSPKTSRGFVRWGKRAKPTAPTACLRLARPTSGHAAEWLCGAKNHGNFSNTPFPCHVASVANPTEQPGCDGTLLPGGKFIERRDGTEEQVTVPD